MTATDALEFLLLGARAIQVGTANYYQSLGSPGDHQRDGCGSCALKSGEHRGIYIGALDTRCVFTISRRGMRFGDE